jgi:hypothetical protein
LQRARRFDIHPYALLDTIGWSQTTPPVAVPIALHENSWALMRALNGAMELADEDVHELARNAGKQVMACASERVGEPYELIADTQARIDTLAVNEGLEPALEIVG